MQKNEKELAFWIAMGYITIQAARKPPDFLDHTESGVILCQQKRWFSQPVRVRA
jgi:hypothetical protein